MNVAVTLPDKECRGHSFLEEGLVVAAAADLAAAKCDAEVFRSRARDVGQSTSETTTDPDYRKINRLPTP